MRGTSRFGLATALSVLIGTVPLCLQARAGDDDVTVLVIDPDDGCTSGVESLRTALEAHLMGHRTVVGSYRVPVLPASKPEQARVARSAVGDVGVRVVIWADPVIETVYMMLLEGKSERIVVREIPGIREGLEPFCDAVASMVQSALVGMIEKKEKVPGGWMEAQMEDSESPLVPDAPEPQPVPLEMGVFFSAGYGLHLGTGTRPVNHGVHFALGYLLTRYAGLEINTDLPHAAKTDLGGVSFDTAALVRWPVRFLLQGFIPLGRVSFGLGLGLDIEMVRVQEDSGSAVVAGFDDVRPALAAQLLVRVEIVRWLEAWLKVGLEAFGSPYEYEVSSSLTDSKPKMVILEYGQIQSVATLGMTVKWTWETSPRRRPPVEAPRRR